MTMQIRDQFWFEAEQWSLWGVSHDELFEPVEYGISPQGGSTACYRGFHGVYGLDEGQLHLVKLTISIDPKTAPPLHGIQPVNLLPWDGGPRHPCGSVQYQDILLLIPYTGGLQICRERAESVSRTGPELPWRFKDVRELVFDEGKLTHTYDRSAAMEQLRAEVAANNGEIVLDDSPSDPGEKSFRKYELIQARINSCFEFNYQGGTRF